MSDYANCVCNWILILTVCFILFMLYQLSLTIGYWSILGPLLFAAFMFLPPLICAYFKEWRRK